MSGVAGRHHYKRRLTVLQRNCGGAKIACRHCSERRLAVLLIPARAQVRYCTINGSMISRLISIPRGADLAKCFFMAAFITHKVSDLCELTSLIILFMLSEKRGLK